MTVVLLDTHAWAWSLNDDVRLTETARHALATADLVYISPISLFEIGQKVRIGKWPEMAVHLAQLPSLIAAQGAKTAAASPEVCLLAATLPWLHRDPFDRLLAATALHFGLHLISADGVFDELQKTQGWKRRIW